MASITRSGTFTWKRISRPSSQGLSSVDKCSYLDYGNNNNILDSNSDEQPIYYYIFLGPQPHATEQESAQDELEQLSTIDEAKSKLEQLARESIKLRLLNYEGKGKESSKAEHRGTRTEEETHTDKVKNGEIEQYMRVHVIELSGPSGLENAKCLARQVLNDTIPLVSGEDAAVIADEAGAGVGEGADVTADGAGAGVEEDATGPNEGDDALSALATQNNGFGVIIQGIFPRDDTSTKKLALKLCFHCPYLRRYERAPDTGNGSGRLSLSQYRQKLIPTSESNGQDENIVVEQAWFLVLNDDIIIAARSGENQSGDFINPKQERVWGFHYLIHLIASTLRSNEREIIHELEHITSQNELQYIYGEGQPIARSDLNKIRLRLKTIELVVDQQIKLLKDLEDVFTKAGPDYQTSPAIFNSIYHLNLIEIPVISWGTTERRWHVLVTLKKVIEERESMRRRITDIMKKQDFFTTVTQGLSEAKQREKLLGDINAETRALNEEIAYQGKTMSVFTFVSVLFLPLAFCSQYFSPEPSPRNGVIGSSIAYFWAVTGSITATTFLVSLFYMVGSWYDWREVKRFFLDGFTERKWRTLLMKADAHSHTSYLRRLRRYRIKAIEIPKISSANGSANGSGKPDNAKEFYLQQPPDHWPGPKRAIPLEFRWASTSVNAGIFAFDEAEGWLFLTDPDRYTYLYRAEAEIKSYRGKIEPCQLIWKKHRNILDQKPYTFTGAQFEKSESATAPDGGRNAVPPINLKEGGAYLNFLWMFNSKERRERWDVRGANSQCARIFGPATSTPTDPEVKTLSVCDPTTTTTQQSEFMLLMEEIGSIDSV